MRRRSRRWLLVAALVLPFAAQSQERSDSSGFADLRTDGNGIAALRTIVTAGFAGQTAGRALASVAQQAGLNATFDPELPNLRTIIDIPPHSRSAAVALLEIGHASALRARVSQGGQLVFVPVPIVAAQVRVAVADTARRDPVALPTMRVEATRAERRDFDSRPNVGVISVSAEALRSSPTFVEPDLLRSIQTLPGIEARSDWSAGFNVRGGEADQSLVLVDGHPIYNPFHLGGVFSTFIGATVGRVELRTGALPARFGGRLSGVLDVRSALPTSASPSGTVEVSLVSSSASVGRTFASGEGAWMVAARRTYADAVINAFKPDAFPYHFQDAQGHVTTALGKGVRVSATAYVGLDAAGATDDDSDGSGNWGNSLLGTTLSKKVWSAPSPRRLVGDSVTFEQRASVTRFNAALLVPLELLEVTNDVTDMRVGGNLTAHGASATTVIGYELARQRMTYQATSSAAVFGDLVPVDSLAQRLGSAALFVDHLWKPRSNVLVNIGGRWESIASASWTGLSPRLSIKYFVGENTAITAGGGRYVQWVHSLGREEEPVQPLQFWVGGDSLTPVSRARDAVVGVERWVTPTRLLHLEAYYKRYDRVLSPNPHNDSRERGDEFTPATGYSYGLDFLVRQLEGGPFSGWLAYTYAYGTRLDANGVRYAPTQDRRHNFNLVGSWHAGAYTLGARVNLASGHPITPVLGEYSRDRYDPSRTRWGFDQASPSEQVISGPRNSERLPWYQRIDVSLTRTRPLFGAITPYLSVLNVLNAKNPAGYVYSFGAQNTRSSFPNLPFTPTFGVRVAY